MPDQISVSEFIAETNKDYNSPTTSNFTTRLHNCRNTVMLLEEVDHFTLRTFSSSVK
ncbi:arf-GAP with SH3 domain, ANK repeat and PH domain-containing protein 1-like [Callospermophilus lateralis]|uniref:arf-GAP with SH3 domain, ANK repeat and PH domain-containing protein 1-like n=1 Tax=Callospermophilus lateralis TaxID=76772 RepID=UPI004038D7AF